MKKLNLLFALAVIFIATSYNAAAQITTIVRTNFTDPNFINFRVGPSPANNFIYLFPDGPGIDKLKTANISLVDMYGTRIMYMEHYNNLVPLNGKPIIQDGIYDLIVRDVSGEILYSVLILRKK